MAESARNNIYWTACAKKSSFEATGRQRTCCAIDERTNNPKPKSSQFKKGYSFVLKNAELNNGFSSEQGRVRPAPSVRTVSVGGRGRHDRFSGEILLDFQVGPPPDPSRFMQGAYSAPQESDRTGK